MKSGRYPSPPTYTPFRLIQPDGGLNTILRRYAMSLPYPHLGREQKALLLVEMRSIRISLGPIDLGRQCEGCSSPATRCNIVRSANNRSKRWQSPRSTRKTFSRAWRSSASISGNGPIGDQHVEGPIAFPFTPSGQILVDFGSPRPTRGRLPATAQGRAQRRLQDVVLRRFRPPSFLFAQRHRVIGLSLSPHEQPFR